MPIKTTKKCLQTIQNLETMEDTYYYITAGNTFLSIEFIITIQPDVPLSSYMGLMGSGHPISSDHGNPYNGAIDHFETIPQFVHVFTQVLTIKMM